VDRVRLSYERRAQDYPRQCIFIGSTNDQEYLNDETGNRRYWPIKVGRARRKWLERHRDQLWSEAKYRYELGEKLYLSKEVEDIAKGEQEKRFEVDEWEALIRKIVETQEGPFITTELFKAIHDGMPAGHPDMLASKRIGKVMRRLGYHRTEVTLENKPRCKGWVER
jgi:putative DNA primase/helicase